MPIKARCDFGDALETKAFPLVVDLGARRGQPGGEPGGPVHQRWRRSDQVTPPRQEAGDPAERQQRCTENDALEPPLTAIRSLEEVESLLAVGFAPP